MKHNTNKRRVKKKVSNKRRRTQKKGGFWPFTTFREQTDYISKEEHQKKCMNFDKPCPMLDTQLTNTKNVTNKSTLKSYLNIDIDTLKNYAIPRLIDRYLHQQISKVQTKLML
jgi:hypothetical protein